MAGLIQLEALDAPLRDKFRTLGLSVQAGVLAKAIRIVAGQGAASLKASTPVGPTGNLKKSIGQKVARYSGSGVAIGFIGPRWPLGAHGHLVEHGTKARYAKDGDFRGVMQPKPFLAPWYEHNKEEIERGLVGALKLVLEAEFK